MTRPGGFAADLDALAELGWGPDKLDALARFQPGAFADFRALDEDARGFVVKVLEGAATEQDYVEFEERADSEAIAKWMLTLPAFVGDYEDGEE